MRVKNSLKEQNVRDSNEGAINFKNYKGMDTFFSFFEFEDTIEFQYARLNLPWQA